MVTLRAEQARIAIAMERLRAQVQQIAQALGLELAKPEDE